MPPMLLCSLILSHSSQLAHHPLQGNATCNWTALLCRAQPFFLTLRVFINPWLRSRHVRYPIMSLWSQWGHSYVNIHGFLASVCCPSCTHTSHSRCFAKESLSLLHHPAPQALPNCTSCFHFSSEFKPHFKQLVMEGVGTRQRERWDAGTPADVAYRLHRISVVNGTLRRVTVIYLLLAPDGSRGGFNRSLTGLVSSWVFWRTQISHLSVTLLLKVPLSRGFPWSGISVCRLMKIQFALVKRTGQWGRLFFLKRWEISLCLSLYRRKQKSPLSPSAAQWFSKHHNPTDAEPPVTSVRLTCVKCCCLWCPAQIFCSFENSTRRDAIHHLWGCDSDIFARSTLWSVPQISQWAR